ncbi:MAG: BMP family ABC transporter substrate-binding protein [Oscillospiraceae bacterium]
MKKISALLLVLVMAFVFVACSGTTAPSSSTATSAGSVASTVPSNFKLGVILVHDENSGYDMAHIEGIWAARDALGLTDDQIVFRYNIPEDETCYDTAMDLVDAGCTIIISDSYGHQGFMQQAAAEVPEVTFVAATGDTAGPSGLPNLKNTFTYVYESRYVSGLVAGLKLKELMDAGTVTDPHIGYVGAYPYAEVVSGYTAFFLGIRSIVPDAYMDVQYTNSWYDPVAEGEAANALIAAGCVIIGQHADSTGAPSAVQAALDSGRVAYSVGYNIDMLSVAPTAALTSAQNNWGALYTKILGQAVNGEEIPTDTALGYADDAVMISALGESCAEGTQASVDAAWASIKDGSLKVFDCSTFTVAGETVTTYDQVYGFEGNEMIVDGYFQESVLRSAPCFDLRIDGITELS